MRGRQVRLIVSLVVASLLASVLVYTAVFGGTVRVLQVRDVLAKPASATATVRLDGKVVSARGDAGSPAGMRFVLADLSVPSRRLTVVYHGQVPDAFARGRSVIVDGALSRSEFVAKTDSLSTKCPSKYTGSSSTTPAA